MVGVCAASKQVPNESGRDTKYHKWKFIKEDTIRLLPIFRGPLAESKSVESYLIVTASPPANKQGKRAGRLTDAERFQATRQLSKRDYKRKRKTRTVEDNGKENFWCHPAKVKLAISGWWKESEKDREVRGCKEEDASDEWVPTYNEMYVQAMLKKGGPGPTDIYSDEHGASLLKFIAKPTTRYTFIRYEDL